MLSNTLIGLCAGFAALLAAPLGALCAKRAGLEVSPDGDEDDRRSVERQA